MMTAQAERRIKNGEMVLFYIGDEPVFRGDIIWHPDRRKVGWYCIAEFPENHGSVVVRAEGGGVPTVLVSELRLEPPNWNFVEVRDGINRLKRTLERNFGE